MSESNPYAPPAARVEDRYDPDAYELAGRGQRLAAATIDAIIQFAIAWPVLSLFGIWNQVRSDGSLPLSLQFFGLTVGMLIFIGVNGYFLYRNGQTIGKKIMRIRIADLANHVPDLWKLIGLRYVPIMLLTLLPFGNFLVLVNVLFIFRGDRRCVHDFIAGTRVVLAR